MIKVAGVRFRGSGKLYWFDPGSFEIRQGSHVIVETARGPEYGTVSGPIREIEPESVPAPLRPIIRVASEEDEARYARNREREKEAMAVCKEKIRKHGLEMKLIDTEFTFDNSKILFFFTADGRVDFRELVKDLAGVFRTRIELRQIGVRDETKILGGIGICGRPLCCHTWLTDFVPVSIKMAKEQSLSLNPTKISGVCGRLMCCLKNEEDTYEYLNSKLPANGDMVTTPSGQMGKVTSVSVLHQKVKVMLEVDDEKEIQEYDAADLIFTPRKPKGKKDKDNRDKNGGREAEPKAQESGREKGAREGRDAKEPKEGKGAREGREGKEAKEGKEAREGREAGEGKDTRGAREGKDTRDVKDAPAPEGEEKAQTGEGTPHRRHRHRRKKKE